MNAKNAIALAMLAMLSTLGCETTQNFLMTGKLEAPTRYQVQDAAQVHSPEGCETCANGGHTVPGYISVKSSDPPLQDLDAPQQQSMAGAPQGMPSTPQGAAESMYR